MLTQSLMIQYNNILHRRPGAYVFIIVLYAVFSFSFGHEEAGEAKKNVFQNLFYLSGEFINEGGGGCLYFIIPYLGMCFLTQSRLPE